MELDYRAIEAIRHTLPEDKQEAKRYYGKHPYFTTRAWNLVQAYIRHFSQESDVVLDPFGGSGVTAVEALILGRRGIHIDISPLSVFLAKQTAISPINLTEASEAFARVKSQCEHQINTWFQMENEESNGLSADYWYPKDYPLPQNADVEFVHQLFTPRQLVSLAFLRDAIMREEKEELRDLLLLAFSATLAKTNRTFVSATGRKASRGGSAVFSMYRYYVPAAPVELNVWEQFSMRWKRVIQAKKETNELIQDRYSPDTFQAINASATDLLDYLEEESVDYIFTDPPYGAHIAYVDLSAMWHAWLQFDVPDALKAKEAIENGDVGHSRERYFDLMAEAFNQMFRALRYGRWMSLVFAHKDASYWNAIVTAAQNAGFEYVNSTPQSPNVVWSMHKKKNPLTVLAGNMILNFRKVRTPTTIAITNVGADAVQLMKNTAELVIVRNGGAATTDEIVNEIVVKLLENGLLGEVKTKMGDIAPFLQEYFVFSEVDDSWHLPRNFRIGAFIPIEDRIKFYLIDYLNRVVRFGEQADFDQIVMNILPQLINGETPETQTILGILKQIAYSEDGKHWQLRQPDDREGVSQLSLFSDEDLKQKSIPSLFTPITEEQLTHNAIIYRLAKLGMAAGYTVWVGRHERSTEFSGEKLALLSVEMLLLPGEVEDYTRKAIEQIDLIWLNQFNQPEFAFEVEHTTTVKSALERFVEMLKVAPQAAGRLVILAPSKRRRKLTQELTQSAFIGHPFYMETKVRYVFYDELVKLYENLSQSRYKKQDIVDKLMAILRRPMAKEL